MGKSVAPEQIASAILVLRGHRVLLDAELAALYGVTTKRLNEQVKRNAARFPGDFIFRLTTTETVARNGSQNTWCEPSSSRERCSLRTGNWPPLRTARNSARQNAHHPR
jgi:hypothetical protein